MPNEAGQYVGDQINEYTPIQEGIRGLMDRFGVTSSAEDRANESMKPGFVDNQMKLNQVAKSVGVDPSTMAIANIVAKQESGSNFLSPEALGRVNPQGDSFGAFQLYKNGGLPAFIKSDGAKFGITAQVGTPEFIQQWKKAAKEQPVEFGAAQLKAFETNYLNPTRNQLAEILPGKTDQRVLSYFTSRQVQGALTANDKKAVLEAYDKANGDIQGFLENFAAYDKKIYPSRFQTENAKRADDKTKYSIDRHINRVNQNLTAALGMTTTERTVANVGKGVDAVKDMADVVGQQPAVQAVTSLGAGLVDKTRGSLTDKLESIFPIKTGFEKPAPAQSVYDQFAAIPQPTAAAPAKAESSGFNRNDLADFLMLSGATGLANPDPRALTSLGKGWTAGLAGKTAAQEKQAERALKARENELNRSEKRFGNLLKLKIQQIKQRMPEVTDPEEREARAYYEVLSQMSPQELANQGLTPQDIAKSKAALGGMGGGAKTKPLSAFDKS